MSIKRILRIISASAAGCALLAAAACNKDEPGGNNTLSNRVYQQYEVRVIDGSVQAFANLRRASATGERVRLSGVSALMANDREMNYTQPQTPDMPEFTYSLPLDPSVKSVTFTMRVTSDFALTNTLSLASIPEARYTLTDNTLGGGSMMKIDMTGLQPDEVSVGLSASPLADPSLTVVGSVAAGGMVVFPSLPPAGEYWMTITTRRVFRTTENDGEASGTITGVRTVTRRVTVSD